MYMGNMQVEEQIKNLYIIEGNINFFRMLKDPNNNFMIIPNDAIRNKVLGIVNDSGLETIVKNYNVSNDTIQAWFRRVDRLPLKVLFDLIIIYSSKYKKTNNETLSLVGFFLNNISEFSCQGSQKTYLPNKFSLDLLYLTGLIMGDGSLPITFNGDGKRQYSIYIEKANQKFIYCVIKKLFSDIFKITPKIHKSYERKEIRYRCYIRSRVIYSFLNVLLDIPVGKKSHCITFPKFLKDIDIDYTFALFSGLVDTDWGRQRWNRFGTHMSSEFLAEDYRNFLALFGIKLFVKKYIQQGRFVSYQCYLYKGDEKKLFNILNEHYPIRNEKRINLLINADLAESR